MVSWLGGGGFGLKLVVKFWFLTQNDENILLFSYQTSSMKHHLTETHEHHFEIHNIVLSSHSISLIINGNNDGWNMVSNILLEMLALNREFIRT